MDKIRYQLVMNGLKRAKWIITDAEFTKQEIIKYLKFPPQNIFVVPLGVDTHQFHKKKISLQETKTYRKGSLGPVLLYVGSEISRMNFTIILRALARLRKEMPTATLIKVGEAKSLNGRRESMRIIHELQLQNAVSFVEYVSEDELVNYYNTADVFIYPIAYTGYGLPVLEAMACGCPVITTTTSTLPEVAGDAALFFEPSDVVQLQKHISTIITNKKVREKLQKRGFAHIKNLTWEQCAEKTFYVYQQILQLTPEKEGRICLEK